MIGSIHKNIQEEIKRKKRGNLVFLWDYNSFGSPDAIRQTFSRLSRENFIIRLSLGIYLYPKLSKKAGSPVYPTIEDIIRQISKKENTKILPTGQYTLYRLGLINELPKNIHFYSTVGIQTIMIPDGITLSFQRNFTKYFSLKGIYSTLAILALMEIGEENITENDLVKIKNALSKEKPETVSHDAGIAPEWIAKIMIDLTK